MGMLRTLTTLLVLAALACGEAGPVDRTLVLSEDYVRFTALGDSVRLFALWHDAAGAPIDTARVTWEARDVQVVEARSNGVVVARGNGSTIVRARVDGAVDSAWVSVAQVPSRLVLVPTSARLTARGDSAAFVASVRDANDHPLTGVHVSWDVEDPRIALVDTLRGVVRANTTGTTALVARVGGITARAEIAVVQAPSGIWIQTSHWRWIAVGDTARYTAEVRDREGAPIPDAMVSWSVDDPLLASVTDGVVVPKPGSALQVIRVRAAVEPLQVSDSLMVLGSAVFRSVGAGYNHTCALTADSNAYCWGNNIEAPTQVLGGHDFTTLAVGTAHRCGLTPSGDAWCWGAGSFGELGTGSRSGLGAPVVPVVGGPWSAIAAGSNHTCALTPTGVAYCWGRGSQGALGNAGTTDRLVPDSVHTDRRFTAISAGAGFTCAETVTGEAHCWGLNAAGQLGRGFMSPSETRPGQVIPTVAFSGVTAGDAHACALAPDGFAYCWGHATWGALGRLTIGNQAEPAPVTGGHQFVAVDPGFRHTCGVTTGAEVWCWGNNAWGTLGSGTPVVGSATPVIVSAGAPFAGVSAGYDHSCAVAVSGDVYCWGLGDVGQLGVGVRPNGGAPTRVPGVWR